jgi:diaminohydroxyphosphoribosylaminopyrimidine deaminase/5-amino-6-(5-phosphoribosylamino)uracil reductase
MDYMAQALSLAKLALGHVSPNPAVGAVIVKNGRVVGQGYTQPPGLPTLKS